MEKFLDNIERYKFAIIGTALVHVLFFLTSNMVTLDSPYQSHFTNAEDEITEIQIESDEIEIDPAMLEMLNQQNQMNDQAMANIAADANDQRERSYQNFSSQELEAQVLAEAKALEQQYFEEWANSHGDGEGAGKPDVEPKEQTTTDQRVNPNAQSSELDRTGDKAYAGPVMLSYSLKNRKANSLKIPGYTCNGSGTVVIDIKVDKNGDVKSALFNPTLSQNVSECMIEKSLKYAKMARFNYDSSATGLASGTITYKFQGQ